LLNISDLLLLVGMFEYRKGDLIACLVPARAKQGLPITAYHCYIFRPIASREQKNA
jgi:hypothetical protein